MFSKGMGGLEWSGKERRKAGLPNAWTADGKSPAFWGNQAQSLALANLLTVQQQLCCSTALNRLTKAASTVKQGNRCCIPSNFMAFHGKNCTWDLQKAQF